MNDVAFVVPLLTPASAAKTWIGEEWRRAIHDPARACNIDVSDDKSALPAVALASFATGTIRHCARIPSPNSIFAVSPATSTTRPVTTGRNGSGS